MAKTITAANGTKTSPKVSRPFVHAKTKMSKSKKSKLYKKTYRGQGK